MKIITDEPLKDAPGFKRYADRLSGIIANSNPRFTVGIYGGWGTGKTTLMKMIQNTLTERYSQEIETVWFDSWRYEREQYSAMVPLLRTIIMHLNNVRISIRKIDNINRKREALGKIQKRFKKMLSAVLQTSTMNLGAAGAGINVNIGNILDDYRSDGSFMFGGNKIRLHEHISEHLESELQKIRYTKAGEPKYDFRLVIFVDDLDRCSPDKALELLESIKTFFDIEGIIYVIGIDPRTIDPIIKMKYGKNTKIDGMNYLQKIVQLPFQIPVWNTTELARAIYETIHTTGLPKTDIEKILADSTIKLIMKTAELNPRDVKRFVNTIILSNYIYKENIKDIAGLVAVQAFYFRGNEWLNFLRSITSYSTRIKFLKFFILATEGDKFVSTVEDLDKRVIELRDKKRYIIEDDILNIFKSLSELNDNDLLTFLKVSAVSLLKISNINKYLRALETHEISDPSVKAVDIDAETQINLLRAGKIEEFNQHSEGILIHFPYENLSRLKLPNVNLERGFLFKVNFSGSELNGAFMEYADLSFGNLEGTNFVNTFTDYIDLTGANLRHADLTGASLIGANLSDADLSMATLFDTHFHSSNLRNADFSSANTKGVRLNNTDLSAAKFIENDLSGADLSESNLTNTVFLNITHLDGANFKDSKFANAIIDDANFLEFLRKKNVSTELPLDIHDKKQLMNQLEKVGFTKYGAQYYASKSKLPEK